ncbi:glycosyltransferase [Pedobacter arcticus]|uniref:glycosyltransferase n=1 Tax=Pedobacter arcticus TaxID=752140 RepID=UPI0003139D2C|nr:glycosyltransferase [Pedobacter arcticus]
MILVLLGTFVTEFKRPLLEIDRLCREGIITEEVIVQSGHTVIDTKHLIMKPFISPKELDELHQNARIIITHAGTGSLIKAVGFHKKIIGVARLIKHGEHVDDHQLEILDKFVELGYVMPWHEQDKLESVLNKIDDFKPVPFVSNKPVIMNYLSDYIDSL